MWPSLAWATWLFNAANIALIASLAGGVVATFLIVWMGNVKEEYAIREASDLRARLSVTDAKTAELNAANLKLEAQIQPRRILPFRNELADPLLDISNATIIVASYNLDAESLVLAGQIMALLNQKHIRIRDARAAIQPLGFIDFGVRVTGQNALAVNTLSKVLIAVGVPVETKPLARQGGVFMAPGNVDLTNADATIFVGTKQLPQVPKAAPGP